MTDYQALMQNTKLYPMEFQDMQMAEFDALLTYQGMESRWMRDMFTVFLSNHKQKDDVIAKAVNPTVYDEAEALLNRVTIEREQYMFETSMSWKEIVEEIESAISPNDEDKEKRKSVYDDPQPSTSSDYFYAPMSPTYDPVSPPPVKRAKFTTEPDSAEEIEQAGTMEGVEEQEEGLEEEEYSFDTGEFTVDEAPGMTSTILDDDVLRTYKICFLGCGSAGIRNQNELMVNFGASPINENFFTAIYYYGSSEIPEYEKIKFVYVHFNPAIEVTGAERLNADSLYLKLSDDIRLDKIMDKIELVIASRDGNEFYSTIVCPGEKFARSFLTLRSHYIQDQALDAIEENVLETIMMHSAFQEEYVKWSESVEEKFIVTERDNKFKLLKERSKESELLEFKIEMFLEEMHDFWEERKSIEEKSKWKGKFSPTTLTISKHVENDKDHMIINEWKKDIGNLEFQEFVNWDVEKRVILMKNFLDFWESFNEIELETNDLGEVKTKPKDRNWVHFKGIECVFRILPLLGIKGKKPVHSDNPAGTKQPEKVDLTPKGYGEWMVKLISEMKMSSNYSWGEELKSEMKINPSPIDDFSEMVVLNLYERVRVMMYQGTKSKLVNFSSRLGGPYSIGGMGKNHSKINVMPLIQNCKRNENEYRLVDGICFLGPFHAKAPTDKRMIMTMEEINPEKLDMIKEMYERCFVLKNEEGRLFLVKQNAVRKVDSAYLTYINNSFFLTCNCVGEIIFRKLLRLSTKTKNDSGYEPQRALARAYPDVEESMDIVLNLEVELLLMAMVGCSQEEAILSALRMLFMCSIQWSLEQTIYVLSKNTISKTLKESLINSAYGQYKFDSFWESLKLLYFELRNIPVNIV